MKLTHIFCSLLLLGFPSLLLPTASAAFSQSEIDQASLVARQIDIVSVISSDVYQGRDNGSAGSTAIQAVLIDELELIADGLNTGQTGDDAYKQPFATTATGTNLVAVIPGSDLADEYVMVGAHYDHIGTAGPSIWNGATDNAAGAAAVLAIGKAIDALPSAPRRSIILVLWDAEEDGLVGSLHYASSPLIPLASTIAYVNFDIQGANLLPSLRNSSLAIGAESGGSALKGMVAAAIGQQSLDGRLLSRPFGQERSDHANFIDTIPTVFFTDGTGACYHTPDDDIDVVDLDKLRGQSQLAFRLVIELAETSTPPTLVATSIPAAVYEDAVVIRDVLDNASLDSDLFAPAQQAILAQRRAELQTIVADGPGLFGPADQQTTVLASADAQTALATLACDGFLAAPVPLRPGHRGALIIATLALSGMGSLRTIGAGARPRSARCGRGAISH